MSAHLNRVQLMTPLRCHATKPGISIHLTLKLLDQRISWGPTRETEPTVGDRERGLLQGISLRDFEGCWLGKLEIHRAGWKP